LWFVFGSCCLWRVVLLSLSNKAFIHPKKKKFIFILVGSYC
jgi:hypothetical protein